MITMEIDIYTVAVIMGAIIVIGTAFLVLKSTAKMGAVQSQKQPLAEKIKPPATPKTSPISALVFDGLASLLELSLRKLNGQRRNLPQVQPAISQGQSVLGEQASTPLPEILGTGPNLNAPLPPVGRKIPVGEPASEKVPEAAAIDILQAMAEPAQELLQPEPVNEEEIEAATIDILQAAAELAQEQPQPEPVNEEEIEQSEDEAHDYDGEPQEQPKIPDTVMDLFTNEVLEESETSKLAANLSNVDVHNILEEAQSLTNQTRGS